MNQFIRNLGRKKELSLASYVVEIIAVALVYILSARVGQVFAIPPGNITPVWIPSGLMLAWAIIRGNYIWPGIFIGAFLGNIWAYTNFSSIAAILPSLIPGIANGFGDAICSVGAAFLLKRVTSEGDLFRDLTSFLWFFALAVILGPFVSAFLGSGSLLLAGFLSGSSYPNALFTWFIGDAVGVLLFAPFILIHYFPYKNPRKDPHTLEISAYILALLPIPLLPLFPEYLNILKQQPTLLVIPILAWSALRMSRIIFFYSTAYLAIGFVTANFFGFGLFAGQTLFESLLSIQLFIIVTVSLVIISTSVITEKDNAIARLQESNNHDPLTTLFNRQYLERRLMEEISRQERHGIPLCLLMYDIDFFKAVNDTYGHVFGDNILIKLSELVSNEIRTIDVLARWGGEEFMILLPETHLKGACEFAERVRAHVERARLIPTGKLTISIGVVEIDKENDINAITTRLDGALYDAKESGRNQVKFA